MIVAVAKDDDIFLFANQRSADGIDVPQRAMSLKRSKRLAANMRKRMEARFRAAPFTLYGLPPSWIGDRFLGGAEWGTQKWQRERISALSLVHGVLVAGEGSELLVETSSPQSLGGGWLANAAGMVWAGFSSNIGDAVVEVHRGDPLASEEPAPIPSHIRLSFAVEGVATSFDAFSYGDKWVARAQLGDHWLTVEGRPFDPINVTLVRVRDIGPYIVGTRAFYARR